MEIKLPDSKRIDDLEKRLTKAETWLYITSTTLMMMMTGIGFVILSLVLYYTKIVKG